LGSNVHLSDIVLPKGVTSVALSHGEDSDLSVAAVQAPKGVVDSEGSADGADGGAAGDSGASEE